MTIDDTADEIVRTDPDARSWDDLIDYDRERLLEAVMDTIESPVDLLDSGDHDRLHECVHNMLAYRLTSARSDAIEDNYSEWRMKLCEAVEKAALRYVEQSVRAAIREAIARRDGDDCDEAAHDSRQRARDWLADAYALGAMQSGVKA